MSRPGIFVPQNNTMSKLAQSDYVASYNYQERNLTLSLLRLIFLIEQHSAPESKCSPFTISFLPFMVALII